MKSTNRFSMEAQATIAFIVAQILFKIIFEFERSRIFAQTHPMPAFAIIVIFTIASAVIGLLCLALRPGRQIAGVRRGWTSRGLDHARGLLPGGRHCPFSIGSLGSLSCALTHVSISGISGLRWLVERSLQPSPGQTRALHVRLAWRVGSVPGQQVL